MTVFTLPSRRHCCLAHAYCRLMVLSFCTAAGAYSAVAATAATTYPSAVFVANSLAGDMPTSRNPLGYSDQSYSDKGYSDKIYSDMGYSDKGYHAIGNAVDNLPINDNDAGYYQSNQKGQSNQGGYSPPDAAYHLPELGSGGDRFIEVNQQQALGEWSLQRLNGAVPVLADAWTHEQLETMAWSINAQARSQAPLALIVVNNIAINAFAIPGGVMGINTGTILAANSMDEVASVMAHEVAHLSQRHYEHRGDSDKKALFIQVAGVLAAIAASQVDSNAATAVMLGSQTAALNSQMAFSRSNEREADRIGMQLMAKSGYDPSAMPRFFATLEQQSQLNSSKQAYLPSFIMSHPLTAERLSEAQSRAREYSRSGLTRPFNSQLNDQRRAQQFALLQWRLKVLCNQVSQTELELAAYRHANSNNNANSNASNNDDKPSSENSNERKKVIQNQAAALALAYWYGSQGHYRQAQEVIEQLQAMQRLALLPSANDKANNRANDKANNRANNKANNLDTLNHNPGNSHLAEAEVLTAITEAQLLGMQGQWDTAATVLQPYQRLYPERRDLKLFMSDIWLQQAPAQPDSTRSNHYRDVVASLKPLLQTRPQDIEVMRRMQRAYAAMAQAALTQPTLTQAALNQEPLATTEHSTQTDAAFASIATSQALRYRALTELWQAQYDEALVSIQQAKTVALALNSINNHSANTSSHSSSLEYQTAVDSVNVAPLLAVLDNDLQTIKNAKDFRP